MTDLREIEDKLHAAKEVVKRLIAEKKLCLSLSKVKLNWGERLQPEEKAAISSKVEKYLGQEHVQAVLSACSVFRKGVIQMRHDNLARFQQRPEGRPGRPKGSSDYNAKVLINSLAAVWQKAKGTLPRQFESLFGTFVKDIAEALQAKDASGNLVTWAGQVNEILRCELYEQVREGSVDFIDLPFDFAEKLETIDYCDLEEKKARQSALCIGAVLTGIEMALEESRVREEIKKIHGIENFTVEIKLKTTDISTPHSESFQEDETK